MSVKDWLMGPAGAAYLTQEYVLGNRSTYELAQEKGTYPNMVRRALVHHGLERRTRSEAQKQALKKGRHPHPTKGRPREVEVRERIRKGVQEYARTKNDETGFPIGEL